MLDRVQYPFKTDHDVFIALLEDYNASIASLDKRMAEDHQDTLEIKKLLEEQYRLLSDRISVVERELIALDPKEIANVKTDVRELKQWKHDFNRTKHYAWIAASTFFLFMGWFLNYLITLWRIFHH